MPLIVNVILECGKCGARFPTEAHLERPAVPNDDMFNPFTRHEQYYVIGYIENPNYWDIDRTVMCPTCWR